MTEKIQRMELRVGTEVSAVRTRRTELNAELSRVEKALEEVELLFADLPASRLRVAATA
jgi:chaperonin cofactor prefoldin